MLLLRNSAIGLGQSLSYAEVPEDHIEDILDVHPAEKLTEGAGREPQLLRHDFFAALGGRLPRAGKRVSGFFKMRALARPCDQGRLRRKELLAEATDCTHERINAG